MALVCVTIMLMNRLMKIGIALIVNAALLFYATVIFVFGDCFAKECNESAYTVFGVLAIAGGLIGAVVLLAGTILNVKHNPSKWVQLVFVITVYIACALWAYYRFGGGQELLGQWRAQSEFKTTLFKVSKLPAGYSEADMRHSQWSDGGVFGPGTYIETYYEKDEFTNTRSAYIGRFTLKQGDAMNDVAGILPSCTKDPSDCEIVDGKNVKGIRCFINRDPRCSVVIDGTYVSITADSEGGFTREQSISVIDSLVPR